MAKDVRDQSTAKKKKNTHPTANGNRFERLHKITHVSSWVDSLPCRINEHAGDWSLVPTNARREFFLFATCQCIDNSEKGLAFLHAEKKGRTTKEISFPRRTPRKFESSKKEELETGGAVWLAESFVYCCVERKRMFHKQRWNRSSSSTSVQLENTSEDGLADQLNPGGYLLLHHGYGCLFRPCFCSNTSHSLDLSQSTSLLSLVLTSDGLLSPDGHGECPLFRSVSWKTLDLSVYWRIFSGWRLSSRATICWKIVNSRSSHSITERGSIGCSSGCYTVVFKFSNSWKSFSNRIWSVSLALVSCFPSARSSPSDIAGWAMQHAGYLFLDRVWEKDKQTINSISGYYKSCQSPLSVSDERGDSIRSSLIERSLLHTSSSTDRIEKENDLFNLAESMVAHRFCSR